VRPVRTTFLILAVGLVLSCDEEIYFPPEFDVYRIDRDGGHEIRLARMESAGGPYSPRPRFTPDGSRVLYRDGNAWYAVDLNGENRERVLDEPVQDPRFTPDGGRIVYLAGDELVVRELATSTVQRLSAPTERVYELCLAPEGSTVVYVAGAEEEYFRRWIAAVELSGTGRRVLTVDSTDYQLPRFSPDGRKIAFLREDGLWLMNRDGGDVRYLAAVRDCWQFDFSPDGDTILLDMRSGTDHDLFLIAVTGGPKTKLTPDDSHEMYAVFTPDGEQIVYERSVEGEYNIWIMNADGSAARNLTGDTDDANYRPQVSPDGQTIVYTKERRDRAL
jgi:Tol biopolymer transport system component